jgi:adenine-specific DNA-methyltransferase
VVPLGWPLGRYGPTTRRPVEAVVHLDRYSRQPFKTGAGDPYDRLKRALRADIDEAAWGSLYRTVSRPFDRPDSGKIAVKVINHYGDEVLKVFDT